MSAQYLTKIAVGVCVVPKWNSNECENQSIFLVKKWEEEGTDTPEERANEANKRRDIL